MVEFVAKWGKTGFMATFADKTASSMQYIPAIGICQTPCVKT